MENLWSAIDTTKILRTPRDILKEQCNYLNEATGGKVIAQVKPYEGKYQSEHVLVGPAWQIRYNNPKFEIKDFDVQSQLGDTTKFVYEFYLASKAMSKYKYRIMFLYYDASLYPIGISLDSSISNEIDQSNREFRVNTEEEFMDILKRILGSNRVASVITNLLSLNED